MVIFKKQLTFWVGTSMKSATEALPLTTLILSEKHLCFCYVFCFTFWTSWCAFF